MHVPGWILSIWLGQISMDRFHRPICAHSGGLSTSYGEGVSSQGAGQDYQSIIIWRYNILKLRCILKVEATWGSNPITHWICQVVYEGIRHSTCWDPTWHVQRFRLCFLLLVKSNSTNCSECATEKSDSSIFCLGCLDSSPQCSLSSDVCHVNWSSWYTNYADNWQDQTSRTNAASVSKNKRFGFNKNE